MRYTLLLSIVVGVAGCGSDMSTVEGTVSLDGNPVKDASVTFSPSAGGRPATGQTDSNGNFSLKYSRSNKGTPTGDYVVRISSNPGDGEKEKIPPRYNADADLNPEMKVEVKEGSNSFEFKLNSKKQKRKRRKRKRNPDEC